MSGARVLHLVNGEYFGGSARVLMNYLTSDRRRSDVAVGVMFEGELRDRIAAAGIRNELIGMRSRADIGAARQVIHMARHFGADVIHTHQVRNTLLGRLAGMRLSVPVVTHVHSPASRESTQRLRNLTTSAVDRLLARRSARFIAVSASLAADLVRIGVRRDRIRIVPNGVDVPVPMSAQERTSARASLDGSDAEFIVGMVANFRPRKGTEVLIDAVGALVGAHPRLRLVLVGEPFKEQGRDYGAILRTHAARVGLRGKVHFTGFRQDAGRLIAGLDLFVLPSLFGEGMPMVVLEAMAAGIPVVSTPVEGIAEVIRHGENGSLVPSGEVDGLARAIAELESNPALAMRLGAAGRETVIEKYTTDRMVDGIEDVYSEVASGWQRRAR